MNAPCPSFACTHRKCLAVLLPPAGKTLQDAACTVRGCGPLKRASGFTLVELLIVLVIAGILASMAMPSLSNMLLNQRLGTAAEELYMSLNFARSEAATRGLDETITIVPTSTADWGQGWSVNATSGTLKTFQAKKNVKITAPAGAAIAALTYGRNGRLTPPTGQLIFYITNTGAANSGISPRCVIIGLSGQPSIRRDNNKDGDCTNG